MFGICLLHSVMQGGHPCRWLGNLLLPCVCGFVFVSGWFGIRFSMKKILKLYGVGLYAACVCATVPIVQTGDFVLLGYLELVAKLWKNFWFLHAYVVMMCFAPAINFVLEKCGKREAIGLLAPVLGFTFVWSWGMNIPLIGRLFPYTNGLGAFSGFTLLSTYIVARFCRMYLPNPNMRHTLVCGLIALVGVLVFGGDYHSPFSVIIAAVAVYWFAKLPLSSSALTRLLDLIAPSLFSVYLLHSHGRVGFPLIESLQSWLLPYMPIGCAYIFTAIAVFSTCIILDVPRRLVACLFNHMMEKKHA